MSDVQPQSVADELARIRQTRQQLADAGVWLTQERIDELLSPAPKDHLLERIRVIRERLAEAGCSITLEEIDAAINNGRP